MNRAARAFLIATSVVSAATGLAGYGVVLVTTDASTAFVGLGVCLVGLLLFIVCMHAWTDLS